MNENKEKRNVKAILKNILILVILLAVASIISSTHKKMKLDKRNKEYVENYPREIRYYLKDKYGVSFSVDPQYVIHDSGGPIPRTVSNPPYIYEVSESTKGGYVFNVKVYPESAYNNKIRDITDNYSWKFITIEIREWFEAELADYLPEEYKFIVHTAEAYYQNENQATSLKSYFEPDTIPVSVIMHFVIPSDIDIQDTKLTKEIVEKVTFDFNKNYPNAWIEFYILQAKSSNDYQKINVQGLENGSFYLHKDVQSIWNMAETLVLVEVDERDRD